MLKVISYGMKNEADGEFIFCELSTRGPQKILSIGFYSSEGPSLNMIFSIWVDSDSMIERKKKKIIKEIHIPPFCMK